MSFSMMNTTHPFLKGINNSTWILRKTLHFEPQGYVQMVSCPIPIKTIDCLLNRNVFLYWPNTPYPKMSITVELSINQAVVLNSNNWPLFCSLLTSLFPANSLFFEVIGADNWNTVVSEMDSGTIGHFSRLLIFSPWG